LRVNVHVVQDGTVHGELTLIGTQGETDTRAVDGSTCDEVVGALSLTAALALDPEARATPVVAPPPPAPKPPPPKPKPKPPPVEHVEPLKGVHVGIEGIVTQIISPGIEVGGAVFLRLERPSAPRGPSIGIAVLGARNDLIADPDDATFAWNAVQLSVCPIRAVLAGGIEIDPCATLTGGWISGTGRAVITPATVRRTWWSAGLAFGISAPLTRRLALRLDLGVAVPLVKRTFVTTDPPRPVGETPRISPSAGLGFELDF
jgi:hypothetical protein